MSSTDPRDLLGTWQLSRRVDDRLGPVRHVHGTSELSLDDDGRIRWSENGTMTWEGGSAPIYRTLFVEQRDDGWWVTFDDGRDFHPWETDAPVVHPCGADVYEGRIDTAASDAWAVVWNVTGPAKDYTMTSRLTR
ncbi:DUF6314 family protein [Aeromicrobium sp. Leaf350]|uniref:DUF6314 family protein n=1 Tax=Aeromicrobium sp. Leaf350 TaxID=2876565 RepID=UPI001E581CAA|nr:DUF6314 family protein [Aeromicrobium sp. Leaf350]